MICKPFSVKNLNEDRAFTVEFSREITYLGTCAQTPPQGTKHNSVSRLHSPSQIPTAHCSEAGADLGPDTHIHTDIHTYNLFIRFLKTVPFKK